MEEEINYLEDRNLDDAHLDLLMLHEKKSDAAEVHLSEGRILEAVDLSFLMTVRTGKTPPEG